jgi:deoxyadenosine/deoxycytidine kinase
MSTRVAAVRDAVDAHHAVGDGDWVVLCERSVHTDRHVFVEMLCQDGTMSAAEKAFYETAYDYYVSHAYPGNEAGVIYLRATPERCAEQMRRRDRSEESAVPVDYLRRLVERHDEAIPSRWNGDTLQLEADTLGRIPDDDEAARTCAATVFDFITKACGHRAVVAATDISSNE